MPKINIIAAIAFALLTAAVSNAFAEDEGVNLTGTFGIEYSNGNYGTARNTDVLLNLTGVSLQAGNFKFSVSVPYMRISGRGLVVFDAAGNPIVISRRTSIAPDVRTGFGDLNLSSTYAIPPALLDDFEVKLTARIKLPTASERKRLSTGNTDFGMSMDVSRTFGIWGPFVTIGYLIPGQSPTYVLNNTVSISAGTSIELDRNLIAIISYDHDSASAPQVDASQEMFGSLSWIINNSVTLTGYGTAGLSSGSPNAGGGLILSYGFN